MLTKKKGTHAEFLQRSLATHSKVESIDPLGPDLVRVNRKENDAVVVAAASVERLDADLLQDIINDAPERPDYIVNMPVESLVVGDAILLARRLGIGIGHFKELMGALGELDVTQYAPRDIRFVEQNLSQHDKVERIEPLAERHYRITRHGLPAATVVFLYEYDLTIDHLRKAKYRYGSFDAIVITNPHGGATGEADKLATTMNVRLYKWGAFYGALNKRRL